jgi:hypothetical protein
MQYKINTYPTFKIPPLWFLELYVGGRGGGRGGVNFGSVSGQLGTEHMRRHISVLGTGHFSTRY